MNWELILVQICMPAKMYATAPWFSTRPNLRRVYYQINALLVNLYGGSSYLNWNKCKLLKSQIPNSSKSIWCLHLFNAKEILHDEEKIDYGIMEEFNTNYQEENGSTKE